MSNEGHIASDTKGALKSLMLHQLRNRGPMGPAGLERLVFETLTGHRREDIDWDEQCNQNGYFNWVKSFDRMIVELVEDGYIKVRDEKGEPIIVSQEPEHLPEFSDPA